MSSLMRAIARQRWTHVRRENVRLDAVGARRSSENIAVQTLGRRYSSQSTAGQSAPASTGASSATRYLLLAAASGFIGGAAVALTVNRGSETIVHSPSRLNDKYGSPEDFRRAIQELRDTFAQADAVSTDPDDLHVHGYSENDYHPGTCQTHFCALCLTGGAGSFFPERGGVPEVDGRCSESRENCQQVQDARRAVLRRDQSRRQLQIRMSLSSSIRGYSARSDEFSS